jgi:uncharacterized protein (TIGR03083 family)
MKITALVTHADREGRLLATAADLAGPDARIAACDEWRVRDLLRHTGTIHRWATAVVAGGSTSRPSRDAAPSLDGTELVEWFREGHARLVATLRAAPADLECWTFMPAPSPLEFWARRQAHETSIHRADAESALAGDTTATDADFAADGIDELLSGFHGGPRSQVRTDIPRVLRVRTTDTDDVWTVRLSSRPPHTERVTGAAAAPDGPEGPADCELSGTADRLRLVLWNRLPLSAVTLTGDAGTARLWRETSAI